jgi:hypothetical protein
MQTIKTKMKSKKRKLGESKGKTHVKKRKKEIVSGREMHTRDMRSEVLVK